MKEENDILQMLREREDEFRLPLNPGGWEKLEAELVPEETVVPPLTLQPVARRTHLIWRMVAAAILLCLLVSVSRLIRKESKTVVVDKQPVSVVEPVRPSAPEQKADSLQPFPSREKETHAPLSASIEFMPELIISDTILPELHPAETAVVAQNRHKDLGPQPDRRQLVPYHSEKPYREPYRAFWSFGIQGGSNSLNGKQGGYSHYDFEMTQPNKPDPDKPDPKPEQPGEEPPSESPQTKASVGGGSSSGNSETYYYRHRLPVTFGLSLQRKLLPDLAIETGISYTYLHSDILEERKKKIESQRLHYLGIPLKLSWTFYRKNDFSLYASGGGLIEYCLSSNAKVPINRWQPSLNATLGMQLVLRKPLSLFAEPGVSYYYNLNPNRIGSYTRFETIRSVHPFTFNLQLGIRFTY